MRFGVHLPIAGFGGERPAASTLIGCAEVAEALGYTTLCANDHLLFAIPWTDGLVALGAAAARTKSISLMTTAALLVVRGPAPLGSALAALHHLSGGKCRSERSRTTYHRSEEHTSELQSQSNLVCRLLLEKKK